MRLYPNVDADIKKSLCKSIFRNPYFDVPRYDLNACGNETRQSKSCRWQFSHLPKWLPAWGTSQEKNPYKLRRISSVNGTSTRDYVFKCLAQNCHRKLLGNYFISSPYNVNKNERQEYITGRFIFVTQGRREGLVVYALAEEAASTFVSSSQGIELFYLEKRENSRPSRLPP